MRKRAALSLVGMATVAFGAALAAVLGPPRWIPLAGMCAAVLTGAVLLIAFAFLLLDGLEAGRPRRRLPALPEPDEPPPYEPGTGRRAATVSPEEAADVARLLQEN